MLRDWREPRSQLNPNGQYSATRVYGRGGPKRQEGAGMMTKRWKQRPPGSTWGDWGDDDELGRINLVTPEKVLEGIREVQAGKTFCLSLPLDFPGGSSL